MDQGKSLTLDQLTLIDTLITRAQGSGFKVDDLFKTSITEAQAEATPDAHHPLFDFSVHDRRILQQMKELAGQLEHTTSVSQLMELRAQAVKALSRT
jgi:hypothetical protein